MLCDHESSAKILCKKMSYRDVEISMKILRQRFLMESHIEISMET